MDLIGTSIVALFCLGMTGFCAMLIWDVLSDGDWVANIAALFLACIAANFPLVGIMAIIDYLGRV